MTNCAPGCPALHPGLPYSRCWRDDGHDGTHRNVAGIEWPDAQTLIDGDLTVAEWKATCRWCDHPHDGCVAQLSDGAFLCTRPRGHGGNHVACGTNTHSAEVWGQSAAVDEAVGANRGLENWEILSLREDLTVTEGHLAEVRAQRDECAARAAQAERDLADARAMAALWKETARRVTWRYRTALGLADLHARDSLENRNRAVKAEQDLYEADLTIEGLQAQVESWKGRALDALGEMDATVARLEAQLAEAECHDCIRDAAVIEKTRGLTPEQEDQVRLGKIVRDVQNGDGWGVEIGGVKIAPCDTYGRTEDERAAALTAADITDQFVDHVHEDYFWSMDPRVHLDKSALRHALLDAVKRSQEPYDSKNVRALASVLSDFAVADEHSGSRDDLQLARLLDGRGVRVTTEED